MEASNIIMSLLFTFLLGGLFSLLLLLYTQLWLSPNKMRQKLHCQGIRGPKPSFFYGNILDMKKIQKEANLMQPDVDKQVDRAHILRDYTSVVFPYLISWRKKYGRFFLYSTVSKPILHITDPDLVKAVIQCTPFVVGRPEMSERPKAHYLVPKVSLWQMPSFGPMRGRSYRRNSSCTGSRI